MSPSSKDCLRNKGSRRASCLLRARPLLVASLISGDIEVGYTGGTAVLGRGARKVSYLRILSSISSKLTHTIARKPNLKTAEQLRGKRFGIQSIGGSTWMHTILALEHVGIDIKRDHINLLVIGDSVLISQSLGSRPDRRGGTRWRAGSASSSKGFTLIADMTPANIPMLNQAIVVNQDFVQKRADASRTDSDGAGGQPRATPGADEQGDRDKNHDATDYKLSDPTVAEEGYQDLLTSIERKPLPSLEALRNIRRLMAPQNPKAANVKVEESDRRSADSQARRERLHGQSGGGLWAEVNTIDRSLQLKTKSAQESCQAFNRCRLYPG